MPKWLSKILKTVAVEIATHLLAEQQKRTASAVRKDPPNGPPVID